MVLQNFLAVTEISGVVWHRHKFPLLLGLPLNVKFEIFTAAALHAYGK